MHSTLDTMSFEVEIKYRSVDHDLLRQRLLDRGAIALHPVEHEDTYLSHPARNFAVTNEAFRLRRIGTVNRVTYKGPRRSGPTKTREEIEIPFAEGDAAYAKMQLLFETLGFRPIAIVKKTRTTFHLTENGRALEVALDRARYLGDFAEIETSVPAEADLPGAQAAVLELAKELGLSDVEPRSYLRLLLETRAQPLERSN